jgi:signal transduction histidine kinase
MIVTGRRVYYMLAIALFTGLVTYLHFAIVQERFEHIVLEELYYIPLLLGVLRFGLKGALLTYLFVSAFYVPFFFGSWSASLGVFIDRALHLLSSGMFALLAGFIVEREDRYRRQAEKDKHLARIGQAAAVIAHDLKNPLITILGFARRLHEGKEDARSAAEAITESAEDMQAVVNGVLDLSRPLQVVLGQEDIRNVIEQASKMCAAKAVQRSVRLSVRLPDTPLTFAIDRHRMQRALVNLIDNAVDASDKDQTVEIDVEERDGTVRVAIVDHGHGMDRETAENVFIPFFTKKSGGTGLGMAIAKKIIEAHRGTIHVESRPGSGTKILIDLPEDVMHD